MTYSRIFTVWLFALVCVNHVLAAIHTRHSQVTASPAAEPVSSASPSSGEELVVTIDTNLAATAQPPGDKETLNGFERYLAGLRRLSETVQSMGRDWEALEQVLSSAPGEHGHGHETDFPSQVQKLFAFAGTTERLIREVMQKYSKDSAVEMLSGGEAQDPVMDSNGTETTTSSMSVRAALTATVTDLLRLFDQYFDHQKVNHANVNEGEAREEVEVDSLQILVNALEAVAEAHTNYTASISAVRSSAMANSSIGHEDRISSLPQHSSSSASPQEDIAGSASNITHPAAAWRPLGWYENQRGLLQVAAQLKTLLKDNGSDTVLLPEANAETLSTNLSTTTTTTTTTPTTTEKESERPCLPPFQQIAYRMCILQEMQLKLSWSDAQEFCRERGAELAQDMTVIKTRRFLNELYGEDGTRSRWPVWVGGRRGEQQTWRWSGSAGNLEVPSFLWAPGEPRPYSSDLMPEGVCMILDGYRRFHGASLPCHLRRRFVCELRN